MDYAELIQNCEIPALGEILRDFPARVLTLMALAIHEVLKVPEDQLSNSDPSSHPSNASASAPPPELPKLSVSLINYEPLTPLKDLKANLMSRVFRATSCPMPFQSIYFLFFSK
jgi:hypothetical protein